MTHSITTQPYAESGYSERHTLFIFILNIIMLSVVMMSVMAPTSYLTVAFITAVKSLKIGFLPLNYSCN